MNDSIEWGRKGQRNALLICYGKESGQRRAPSMVDQRWKTVRDQRRVQRRMLENIIQAHTYADLRSA